MGRRESPVDPAAGPVQRFAFELRKLRQEAGGLTYRAMAGRAGYSVTTLSQAAAGERLASLPVVRAFAEACGADVSEWERRWRRAAQELAREMAEQDAATEPYPGLASYDTHDHGRFFGRDRLVGELRELLERHRFAAVFGPSGSGKSSLLRAGLVPAEGRARVITPGEHPMRHAGGLLPDGTLIVVDQFEEVFTLCGDPHERARFIELLLDARQPRSRMRVVVAVRADFYGRCAEHRGLTEALREANLLVGPMSQDELREAIVRPAMAGGLTVERALTAAIIADVADEPGALPLMSHALREVWRRRTGKMLTLDAYESAGRVHGAISRTAEELYAGLSPTQARVARRILLRLISPGEQAQDTRRPAARAELDPTARAGLDPTARAGLEPGARAGLEPGARAGLEPGERAELDFGEEADTALVIEKLAGARLLTLHQDTVELAHEALIESWPRLRGWVDEGRDRLRAHRRLTDTAEAWQAQGRDAGLLYRGTRLAVAEKLFAEPGDDLTPLERAFLRAGAALARRTLRTRVAVCAALAVLLVASMVAAGAAIRQAGLADERLREATARLVARRAAVLRTSDPKLARRLSAAAWRIAPVSEARSELIDSMALPLVDVVTAPYGAADLLDGLSVDGTRLAVHVPGAGAGPSSLRVFDLVRRKEVASARWTGRQVTEVVWSPDGRTLAVNDGANAQLWSLGAGGLTDLGVAFSNLDPSEFSPDGRFLLGVRDGMNGAWSVTDRTRLLDKPVSAISPDGRLALVIPARATASASTPPSSGGRTSPGRGAERAGHGADRAERAGRGVERAGRGVERAGRAGRGVERPGRGAELWDLEKRERVRAPWLPATATGGAFGPDGKKLAVLTPDGVRLWEISSGDEATRQPLLPPVGDVTFTPDGRFLAGMLDGGWAFLWRVDDGSVLLSSSALPGVRSTRPRISPDARSLRVTGQYGTVNVLDISPFTHPVVLAPGSDKRVFSPDGRFLATADHQKGRPEVRIWDVATREPVTVPAEHLRKDVKHLRENVEDLPADIGDLPADIGDVRENIGDVRENIGDVRENIGDVRENIGDVRENIEDLREDTAYSPVFSPDGRTLALSHPASPVVSLWDSTSGRALGALRVRSRGAVGALPVTFSPDGRTIAVVPLGAKPDDGQLPDGLQLDDLELWDVPARRWIRTVSGAGAATLIFEPDGRRLLVDGSSRGRSLVDTATGDMREHSSDPRAEGKIRFVGGKAAVGDRDGRVAFWDTRLRTLLAAPQTVHLGPIDALVPDAQGGLLASVSSAGEFGIQLWDSRGYQRIGSSISFHTGSAPAVAFNGTALLISSADGSLREITVDPGTATAAICGRDGGLSPAEWRRHIPELSYQQTCDISE
ncbi:helix-turn-helix domain-containing protein [Nonomuraea sp. NPDC050404]|uniref:nSTAND1 domain-containing NTPase n=1 Tax=Nonomuraea sp. NPDC050404 TaxID=3155783 RepID=UPI0033CD1C32